MSESLRNDGRVWVPKKQGDTRPPEQIPEAERDYYLERKYPSFGNLVPRDVASRNAKQVCDEGRGVGDSGLAVYLDFTDAIKRLGVEVIREKIRQPLRHVHEDHRRGPVQGADADLPGDPLHDGRAVGRLQPDEHVPGPARARRSELLRSRRQPPRRQRADAGARRRLLRHSLHARRLPGEHAAAAGHAPTTTRSRKRPTASSARIDRLLSVKGSADVRADPPRARARSCGTTSAWRGTKRACARRWRRFPKLRDEFWHNVSVPGPPDNLNKSLEYAGRVADYLEFAELLALDALHRTRIVRRPFPRGEPDARRRGAARRRALRVRRGVGVPGRRRGRALHKEPLTFEDVKPTQRSYK